MMLNLLRRPASSPQDIHLVPPLGDRGGEVDATSRIGRASQGCWMCSDLRLADTSNGNTDDVGTSPSRNIVASPTCSAHEDSPLAAPFVFALLTFSLLWPAILFTARGVYSIIVPIH